MGEMEAPLLTHYNSSSKCEFVEENEDLKQRFWVESKKLWIVVGPAIFSRISLYSTNVITQAFAGHLGDAEFAAISIVNNILTGLTYGFLVQYFSAHPINYWHNLYFNQNALICTILENKSLN